MTRRRAANWAVVPLISLVMFPLLISAVTGDGIIIDPWGIPYEEGAQTAIIHWLENFETLALHVSSDAPIGSFWLVPVPNHPEMVVVSHVESLTFSGYDRGVEAWRAAKSWTAVWFAGGALTSQLYPTVSPFSWLLVYRLGIRRPPIYVPLIENAEWLSREGGMVTIHEVVESYGLTSYLVTAQDADSLHEFMRAIGLRVPEELETALAYYMGKEFSFVISRVSSYAMRDGEHPLNVSSSEGSRDAVSMPIVRPQGLGVVISFPHDEPFYPLIPTSVYGSEVVPVRLYLNGLWDPSHLDQPLSTFTKVEHFVYGHIWVNTYPRISPLSDTELSDYTLVTMNPPSKYLTSDLTFRPAAVVRLAVDFAWVVGVLVFLVCSILASGIASAVLGRRDRRDLGKSLTLGLSNLLTLAGYYWMSSKVLGKEVHETSSRKALAVSMSLMLLLLLAGVSAVEFWLVLPHYNWQSVLLTPVVSILAFSPALAILWVYSKLNSSAIAAGAPSNPTPINVRAAGQTLIFSVVFVTLFAIATHALLMLY